MHNTIRLAIGLALAWALVSATAEAQTFQTLSVFPSGSSSDPAPGGAVPVAGLIKVGKTLYGTTASGANIFQDPPWGCGFSNGCGSVFSVNAATGALTTLYKFCSLPNCADGGHPLAGLVYRDGAFYGTTETGGNLTAGSGAGTVYKLTQDGGGAWVETVLYDFCSTKAYCKDGNNPSALLVFDSAGLIYGTTAGGAPEGGHGTVFKLDPTTGVLTTLHRFTGGSDGGTPVPGLVFGKGGDLYGTTEYGGDGGNGTVFRLKPATGHLTTILAFPTAYNNGNPYWPFGANPVSALLVGRNGVLYGTTPFGGTVGAGVVFELTQDGGGAWVETVLHSFCIDAYCSDGDGSEPNGPLVLDKSGLLYGTTLVGGAGDVTTYPSGTVFVLDPTSLALTILHTFNGVAGTFTTFPNGEQPAAGLAIAFVPGGGSVLYGTTQYGGSTTEDSCYVGYNSGCGTVFKLAP
jgi:uncharacterized repeat protein (TIGR03803 family)